MGYLDKGCGVGADGSLYSKYPGFADRLHQALEDIFGEKGKNIRTYQAEDGSGVGSAIIAAMTKARKEEASTSTSKAKASQLIQIQNKSNVPRCKCQAYC